MDNGRIKQKAFSGAVWNMTTSFGMQAVAFVIQIILARILEPEVYGTIGLVTVFVAVANVFVTTGFASALIQRKEISDIECSTSFYIGLSVAVVLYTVLFFAAPLVATFYKMNILIIILRVQSLTLILGSLISVHKAMIDRAMNFKLTFFINLSGIIAQGLVGIVMALRGFGIWALVASYTVNKVVVVIVTWMVCKWRPKLMFSFASFRGLFSFSSKLLILSLIDTLYSNIRSLIIGKQYNAEQLAYYNRGNQIPSMLSADVLGSVNNVLFPMLSRCQGDEIRFKNAYRRSFKTFFFISFPVYLGLLAVSEPLTIIMLTEKWRDSVIFMQLICIIAMFNPFFVRSHVYNAMGRSDVSMWLSIVDKVVITLTLAMSIYYGSIYILVISQIFSNVVSVIIGLFVNKRILGYSISEQVKDFLPPLLFSIIMFIPTYLVNYIPINYYLKLTIQVFGGALLYYLFSKLSMKDNYQFVLGVFKQRFIKTKTEKRRDEKYD